VPELDWAARESLSRKAALHVVRAYHLSEGTLPWASYVDRELTADLRQAARSHLDAALAHLARKWPEVPATGTAVDGPAADVLVARSATGALTVVGSRRLGALGGIALGSVSTVVAAAAGGPVVVAGGPAALPGEAAEVVVGVDGGEQTGDVLGFAFDHASRHGRPLHAVFCWPRDLLADARWRAPQPGPERADRWLAEQLAGWQEKYPDVPVRRGVVRDHAVAGLVAASAGQELLVVGSHSRHARVAALLGSVSQGVLHHATCPVAIVHPAAPPAPAG
ncbi:MAG TPA: universal stress protein, partial [Jatrophihabitans sp.]|nr:universal stress protein [Jatrophihabitans sp.]